MHQIEHFNPSILTDLNDVIQAAEGRHGVDEHFDDILEYFLNAENEEEMADKDSQLGKFFIELNTNQQTQFLEKLLFFVFEDKKLAHESAIIRIRKQISEVQHNIPDNVHGAIRLVNGMRFEKGKMIGRKFIPPLINYMRSNEYELRRFLGQFHHDHPQKADRVLKEVVSELFASLSSH